MKIVIVDDEEKIRLGLSKLIQKANNSYDIVGLFGSGAECLAYIGELKPDLVITDIKMPGMTGLELVRSLKQKVSDLHCVILSGFGEFEYARSGIMLGVTGYLLKPVDKQELYDILDKIRSTVKSVEADKHMDYHLLLSNLLLGKVDASEAREVIAQHDPQFLAVESYMLAAITSPEDVPAGVEEAWFRIRGVHQVKRIPMENSSMAVIITLDANKEGMIDEIAARLSENLKHESRFAVSIGLSQVMTDIQKWKDGFRAALEANESNYYSTARSPIALADRISFGKLLMVEPQRKKVLESIELMDVSAVRENVKALLEQISAIKLRLYHLAELVESIFYILDREELASDHTEDEQSHVVTVDWGHELRNCGKFKAAQKLIEDKLLTRLEEVRKEKESQGSKKVFQVKKIINQEYKEILELHDLARRVYLTPSYLSKVFKQETGTTVIEYMISVRINKAKELLRSTQLKTYQIGEMVGYNDPAYFNRQFKKIVGITPKEYRQTVL